MQAQMTSDPIYTPLWSAGRTEKFAFVGQIDVDNDGSFVGDRERLHEIVSASGAEISSEVLDDGSRIPKKADDEPLPITEQTRFLVIGSIPEPLDEANLDRRAQLQQMQQHRTDMEKEARTSGVRHSTARNTLMARCWSSSLEPWSQPSFVRLTMQSTGLAAPSLGGADPTMCRTR